MCLKQAKTSIHYLILYNEKRNKHLSKDGGRSLHIVEGVDGSLFMIRIFFVKVFLASMQTYQNIFTSSHNAISSSFHKATKECKWNVSRKIRR